MCGTWDFIFQVFWSFQLVVRSGFYQDSEEAPRKKFPKPKSTATSRAACATQAAASNLCALFALDVFQLKQQPAAKPQNRAPAVRASRKTSASSSTTRAHIEEMTQKSPVDSIATIRSEPGQDMCRKTRARNFAWKTHNSRDTCILAFVHAFLLTSRQASGRNRDKKDRLKLMQADFLSRSLRDKIISPCHTGDSVLWAYDHHYVMIPPVGE